MSSDENKLPRSPKATSSAKTRTESAANAAASPASSSPSSAETIMDQHIDSPLIALSAPPITPEVMSSTAQSNSPVDPVPPKPPNSPHAPRSSAQASAQTASAQTSSVQPTSTQTSSAQASEAPVAPTPTADSVTPDSATDEATVAISRQQPIPPASEPMQYRAIGLVRGKYTPSEDQFTRGTLHTDDGTAIDAVLLGRVMSLVKKHLDLEQPHLWVVYPRTNEREYSLHVQIVGVWEPENLKKADSLDEESGVDESEVEESGVEKPEAVEAAVDTAVEAEEVAPTPIAPAPEAQKPEAHTLEDDMLDLNDRYFSVRGEVVHHVPENEQLLVKIRRAPRQGTDPKAFKVVLKGRLEGKVVGYFWDFNVHREADVLVIQDASLIKIVPPQKGGGDRPKGGMRRGAPSGARKPWTNREGGRPPSREGGAPRPPQRSGSERPSRPTQRDRVERPEQSERKEPISKPIIKRRDKDAPA